MRKHNIRKQNLTNRFIYKKRFEMLFVSLFTTIFGDIFFPYQIVDKIIQPISLGLVLLASYNIVYLNRWKRKAFAFLLLTFLLLSIPSVFIDSHLPRIIIFLISIIGFYIITLEIFTQVIRAQKVDTSTLYAVLSGYLLMGVSGAITFSIVEYLQPGSFGLSDKSALLSDLLYYSFVTLTTVGFGDISPLTIYAKKLTIFYSTAGHFYSVVVMGLILGKYLSQAESRKKSNNELE